MTSNVSKVVTSEPIGLHHRKSKEVPCNSAFCVQFESSSLSVSAENSKKFAFALNLLPLTFKAFWKAILTFILYVYLMSCKSVLKHFSPYLDLDYTSFLLKAYSLKFYFFGNTQDPFPASDKCPMKLIILSFYPNLMPSFFSIPKRT